MQLKFSLSLAQATRNASAPPAFADARRSTGPGRVELALHTRAASPPTETRDDTRGTCQDWPGCRPEGRDRLSSWLFDHPVDGTAALIHPAAIDCQFSCQRGKSREPGGSPLLEEVRRVLHAIGMERPTQTPRNLFARRALIATTGGAAFAARPRKYLLTTNGPSNDVSVVDAALLDAVKSTRVGRLPWGVVVSPK